MATKRSKGKKTLKLWSKFKKLNKKQKFIVIIAFILLIMLGIGGGATVAAVQDMPTFNESALEPAASSLFYDKNGKVFAQIHGPENRIPVSIDQVPQHVRNAFLAIEDVRFYEHHGISLRGIIRAAWVDLTNQGAVQGASTITQQLAKNAFLSREKTLKRKIQEAILSFQIERNYTKDEILEMYLNWIYFGHGAAGIQAASQTYFGKNVDDLEPWEAALLAAIPKNPSRYSPYVNEKEAKKRRDIVIGNMLKYEFITEKEAKKYKEQPVKTAGLPKDRTKYPYPYFTEYVIDKLAGQFGSQKVYYGGLKVYTTLDPQIQKAAEDAITNGKYPNSKRDDKGVIQPQAAAVVMDVHNGEVRAVVGGREHKEQRSLNRAIPDNPSNKRQPGSSFKPIAAYAPAIENGKYPAYTVDDVHIKFGSIQFDNYDGVYHGLTTLREGITGSYNMVAVNLLKEIKFSTGYNFAKSLGFATLKNTPHLGFALGDDAVSPLEMAGAYGAFANEGVYIKPHTILKVVDKDGKVLYEYKPERKVVMKETTAYLMTDMLKSVVKNGTGQGAQIPGWEVAGKTGTTSYAKDLWFAGYTPKYVAVVWIGHDKPKSMGNHSFGSTYAVPIWKQIMTAAHKGLKVTHFKRPKKIVEATVCNKSGLLPGPYCPPEDLVTDIFAEGTVPDKTCDVHIPVEICAATGQLASQFCPDKITNVFLKRRVPFTGEPRPDDAYLEPPTEVCSLHNSAPTISKQVCIDPRHNGIPYLANIAGPGEEGGCDGQYVITKSFASGQEPTQYCILPDHQIKKKTTNKSP